MLRAEPVNADAQWLYTSCRRFLWVTLCLAGDMPAHEASTTRVLP